MFPLIMCNASVSFIEKEDYNVMLPPACVTVGNGVLLDHLYNISLSKHDEMNYCQRVLFLFRLTVPKEF